MSGEYSKKSSDPASRGRADEILVNTFMTFFAYLYGEFKHSVIIIRGEVRKRERGREGGRKIYI